MSKEISDMINELATTMIMLVEDQEKKKKINFKNYILLKKENEEKIELKVVDFVIKDMKKNFLYLHISYDRKTKKFENKEVKTIHKQKIVRENMKGVLELKNILDAIKEKDTLQMNQGEHYLKCIEEKLLEDEKNIYYDAVILMHTVNILKTPFLHDKLMTVTEQIKKEKEKNGYIIHKKEIENELNYIKSEWVEGNKKRI